MKKLYLFFAFTFVTAFTYAQDPFIITWEIYPANLIASIPIQLGANVNYTVDFGDGTILTNQTGPAGHWYTNAGTYTVTVSGTYKQIKFADSSSNTQIKTIEQWGDAQWTTMEQAFKDCPYMIVNATDVPNLTHVTSMKEMFSGTTSFNQPINNWNVSHVTNMSAMFKGSLFNQPLNNWNVSNVTDMSHMFDSSWNDFFFNQPLDDWNVSNVTNMEGMFYGSGFNQPLNNWNVSNVINMKEMFFLDQSFNQPLNNWNVSNVTNMNQMFSYAGSFNQPIGNWNVSNVTDMEAMFLSSDFNQPLNDWDVSNVTNMNRMFYYANAFNQPLNDWNVSNVTNMREMFSEANTFNQILNNWDVSNVTNMRDMFYSAYSFNQPLNNWNVSNVTGLDGMFSYAVAFNQDLSTWNFNSTDYDNFIKNTALDVANYDALLLRFAQLGIENMELDAHGLNYCDTGVRHYLMSGYGVDPGPGLGWFIYGDNLSGNCPGNSITGTILFDQNSNGCDSGDLPVINVLIGASIGAEPVSYAGGTNDMGEYNLEVMEGTHIIAPLNIPAYFVANPLQSTATFADSGNEQEVNFCLTANQSIQDLNITLLPIGGAPRPGFASHYQLIAQNIGTQTVPNASVSLAYDSAIQSFTSAVPAATSATAGQLTFDLTNLEPFEIRVIAITMQTLAPPTVNGGEVINFTASVTPDTGDFTPADNTFALAQTVVNSFDPNDKQVLQGEEISVEQAEGYLDYLIRFQNTGTASAITVRVKDHLPENVDWTTLRPVSSSHPYTLKLKDDNTVEFIFDNINLPNESANEPGSHGFIAYKIKPVGTVAVGDIITGNAEIFFDYNLPIITNFATTEVMDTAGINDNFSNSISIYPNPVSDVLYLHASDGITIEEVKVINLQGRELMSFNDGAESINVENLSSGVYILMIKTNAGIVKHKLVRK